MNYKRTLLLVLAIFVSLTASGCGYNTLTTKQQNVKAKWANVEAQLQRRADLINNLVESAKLAGVQEQEVFGKIAEARSRLLNATSQAPQGEGGDKSPEQKQAVIDAANSFGGTIGRLLVLQEAYPQLQSNQNFHETAGRSSGNGKPDRDCAHGLQRGRAGLQHDPRASFRPSFRQSCLALRKSLTSKPRKERRRRPRSTQTLCVRTPRQPNRLDCGCM